MVEDKWSADSPADIGGQVFKRFVKGKHSPGHGLGLAFVDAVAQAHGGGTQGFGSSGRRRGYHLIATRQLAPGGVGFARCSMLKQFVAHVGPKFLCYVEEVITAICCPHLFAVFPNDRSAAG